MCYTLSDHLCKQLATLLVLVLQRKAKQIPCDAHTAVSFVSTVCPSAGNFFHGIKSYLLAKQSVCEYRWPAKTSGSQRHRGHNQSSHKTSQM